MKKLLGTVAASLLFGLGASGAWASGEFIWPINGRITSTWKYPDGSIHSGSADIANVSWTQIGAGRFGSARPAWEGGGCGNYVYISHASGYTTLYCHMVQWPSVRSGQSVSTNQLIGYVGSTGHSTGPHCHYAIKRWGTRLIIPNIYIGLYVYRGRAVPGSYSGLSGTSTTTPPTTTTNAAVQFQARVTSGPLNVRTGPSTGYSIVGSLSTGTVVNVYGTSNNWYKISYGGNYRWIAGWFTAKVAASSTTFKAKVTAGVLNVRSGPSTGYSIVGTLRYGTIVTVYGTSGSWYKISYGGTYRWIAGWYTVRV